MIGIGLALLMAVSVWGVFAGIRMYRAEAKLPSDLVPVSYTHLTLPTKA